MLLLLLWLSLVLLAFTHFYDKTAKGWCVKHVFKILILLSTPSFVLVLANQIITQSVLPFQSIAASQNLALLIYEHLHVHVHICRCTWTHVCTCSCAYAHARTCTHTDSIFFLFFQSLSISQLFFFFFSSRLELRTT